jgi:hypothetical protein
MPLPSILSRFIARFGRANSFQDRAHQRANGDCFPAPILSNSFHIATTNSDAKELSCQK